MRGRGIRGIAALLAALLLLAGCADQKTAPREYGGETAVLQGEGYTLTYPACFQPVGNTGKMVNYAVAGDNLIFTLTEEENPYGLLPVEEYPDRMGIYLPVTPLGGRSFGVEKYQPGALSAYYVYAFTEDTMYLLEYNFGGEESQRALERLFRIEME